MLNLGFGRTGDLNPSRWRGLVRLASLCSRRERNSVRSHIRNYGHPTKFGFKDIIALWKAESFDPDRLIEKFVAAGAKYFVSMGVHYDNFDLWNSKRNPWNATKTRIQQDALEEWQAAARKKGFASGSLNIRGRASPSIRPAMGATKQANWQEFATMAQTRSGKTCITGPRSQEIRPGIASTRSGRATGKSASRI